jgi:hypothetical protein
MSLILQSQKLSSQIFYRETFVKFCPNNQSFNELNFKKNLDLKIEKIGLNFYF